MDLIEIATVKDNSEQDQQNIQRNEHKTAIEFNDDNASELYYSEESLNEDDPTGFGLYGMISTAQLRTALEESTSITEEAVKISDLDTLLREHYNDRIVYLESTETIETSGFPYIIMFHNFNDYAIELRCYTDMLYQSALQYGDSICFAVTDCVNYETVLNYRPANYAYWKRYKKQGYSKYRRADVYAVDIEHRMYQLIGPLNVDSLKEFSQKLINDELYQTEPIPEDDEEGFVRICVAANFEQLVLKSDVDIFLMLYGMKCPFSRDLMPTLEEVGKLLQDEDIIVVKMNAEANYLPLKYYAWYYPTIYYVRRGDKETLIEYNEGMRTVKDIIRFIAKYATNELLEYNRSGRPRFE